MPLELNIERDRNALFRENNEGLIENTYTLQILNKSQENKEFVISVEGLTDYKYIGLKEIKVNAGEVYKTPISVAVDPYDLEKPVTNITIIVKTKDGEAEVFEESRFFKGR